MYAPGSRIKAADFAGTGGYVKRSGTSMAAPLVAGVAALYIETNRSASPADLYHFLKASAEWGKLKRLNDGDPNCLLHIGRIVSSQSQKLNKSEDHDWGRLDASWAQGRHSMLLSWVLVFWSPAIAEHT